MSALPSLLLCLVFLLGTEAGANESDLEEQVRILEERVADLESDADTSASSEWMDRVRLGGSANTGYYGGGEDTFFDPDSFRIWDARFFVDAELGRDVRIGETRLLRDVGFAFEWDLVRLASLRNRVGDLYVDLRGVLDSNWLSLQIGRFQLPVGENYLRFGRGYRDNPFISNTVGGPWYWDEGVRFFGQDPERPFGYVASVSDGDTPFNKDSNSQKQVTLKLWVDPTDWLHLSVSGVRSDKIGSSSSPASGALWLGEAWARAFGSGSSVPNLHHGVVVADGPNVLEDTWFAGADAVVDLPDLLRLWLAYGYYDIDSDGPGLYDRSLQYWVAELILRGGSVSPALQPLYLALRANALGTYDRGEGYLLDFRYGSSLGYNMEALTAYSVAVGWKLTKYATLRGEYTLQDIDLVRGASPEMRAAADDSDYFGFELGIHF